MIAPFASNPADTRGRAFYEEESAFRSCFQRDRDRIIHSSAFRRLKHKTQVFVEHEGDYFRTRLTHSIEVAQVARTIAGALGLNQELTEAVALAHDLGHTPFGHTGEDALHDLMSPYGGFDHNAQAIKIVTSLERHYADFDGLNLTWESLEAEICHLPIIDKCFAEVDQTYPGLERNRRKHEALRRVFGVMVADVIDTSRALLAEADAKSAQEIREYGAPVIAFSEEVWAQIVEIKSFLFKRMYRAPSVVEKRIQVTKVVETLFPLFMQDKNLLPARWHSDVERLNDEQSIARKVSDYIAGMTDRFALTEYERLTGTKLPL